MSEELQLCPFCGGPEIGFKLLAGHNRKANICMGCEAQGPVVPHEMKHEPIDETTRAADEAWNTRAPDPEITRLQAANAELSKCADGLAESLEAMVEHYAPPCAQSSEWQVRQVAAYEVACQALLTHRKGTGQ